jgi:uncharacterized protein YlxP (DUF503 family)
MVVGVLRLTLVVPGARSLKDKRQALRRIIERVRARYNVSIAEVGDNDVWQRALVGVTAVANEHAFVNQVLDKVVRDVEALAVAQLVNREMEIETYAEMRGGWQDKPMLDRPEDWSPRERAGQEDEVDGDGEGSSPEYLREDDLK